MATNNPQDAAAAARAAEQQNLAIRAHVLDRAQPMMQQIFSSTFTTSLLGRQINIPIQPVGLVQRLLVKIEATFARSAAETLTLTPFGPANILSQIVLNDLSNNNRINTTGWHLHMLATAKRQMAYAAAMVTDTAVDIGSNFPVAYAPQNFGSGTQTLRQYYEVPLSYGDMDLRGAIYAGVVNASMTLQLTLNNTFCQTSTGDPTLAVYQSNGTDLAALSSVTITVYQVYLDQLPMTAGGPLLPPQDMATAYLIQNTVASGAVVNQDLGIPFANFRRFMSTFLIYNNAGVLNPGSDINYFSLQSANYTNIWKIDPITAALAARNIFGDDPPAGCYYFDHRRKPIETVQYGNMQINLNPSAVTAGASVLVGYEMFALINLLTNAGSLYNT